jgi:hypothetical protein
MREKQKRLEDNPLPFKDLRDQKSSRQGTGLSAAQRRVHFEQLASSRDRAAPMPDPIQSSQSSHSSYDPSIYETSEPQICRAPDSPSAAAGEPQKSSNLSPGAQMLVEQNNSSAAARVKQFMSNNGDSNAERTLGREAAPFADAGTNDAKNVWFAGAAVGKGEVAGGSVEALSVSGQVGSQTEAQVGTARLTLGSGESSLQLRAPEVEMHAGVHNPHGCVGATAGASHNLVASEATVGADGNSLTAGVSVGWGGEASGGVRDVDQDGNSEYCARVGLSLQAVPVGFVVGACVEPARLYDAVTR